MKKDGFKVMLKGNLSSGKEEEEKKQKKREIVKRRFDEHAILLPFHMW